MQRSIFERNHKTNVSLTDHASYIAQQKIEFVNQETGRFRWEVIKLTDNLKSLLQSDSVSAFHAKHEELNESINTYLENVLNFANRDEISLATKSLNPLKWYKSDIPEEKVRLERNTQSLLTAIDAGAIIAKENIIKEAINTVVMANEIENKERLRPH